MKTKKQTLCLVVCAAPPAATVDEFIQLAQQQQWDVYVTATPNAQPFINVQRLLEITGHPIRIEYRMPSETKQVPESDAILVIPATFNSINKWALGIADNLALTTLCEALGARKPIIAVPYLKPTLAKHPAFIQSIRLLKRYGVHTLSKQPYISTLADISWTDIYQEIEEMIKIR